eukprot:863187-Pelagomonas_calceolata.AAC.1
MEHSGTRLWACTTPCCTQRHPLTSTLPPVPLHLCYVGTQWHPEKPPYEFGLDSVPHSLEAIKVRHDCHLRSTLPGFSFLVELGIK